jgi:ParB family chromosome partitioning protein
MAKRGGLGRGLDSLIPNRVAKSKASKHKEAETNRQIENRSNAETENLGEDLTSSAASDKKNSPTTKHQKNLSKKLTVGSVTSERDPKEDKGLNKDLQNPDSFSSDGSKKTVNPGAAQAEPLEREGFEGPTDSSEMRTGQESAGMQTNIGDTSDNLKRLNQIDQLEERTEGQKGKIISLRISSVEPNRSQPRKYFDDAAIDELADSIEKFGIISPLLVQKKDDYYEIIAGERRWRAAKRAGLKEVPVIIKDFSDKEAVEVSLIENIQREDLNPIEEAKAYERLVKEYGMNQEEVAGRVSKSRSAVTNSMRLLKLADHVQKLVENGSLSEGHARALIPLDDPSIQEEVAHQIVENRLSVRQTELLVKNLLKPDKPGRKKSRDVRQEAMLKDLAEHLKHKFGTKVNIKPSGKNKGKIEIEYYSDEELDRIYELLQSVR